MLAALYEGRALVWLADPTSRDWGVIGERVIQTLLEGLKVREEAPGEQAPALQAPLEAAFRRTGDAVKKTQRHLSRPPQAAIIYRVTNQ